MTEDMQFLIDNLYDGSIDRARKDLFAALRYAKAVKRGFAFSGFQSAKIEIWVQGSNNGSSPC